MRTFVSHVHDSWTHWLFSNYNPSKQGETSVAIHPLLLTSLQTALWSLSGFPYKSHVTYVATMAAP